eukprot:6816596-Heterocapsa_arctica.AAC.1
MAAAAGVEQRSVYEMLVNRAIGRKVAMDGPKQLGMRRLGPKNRCNPCPMYRNGAFEIWGLASCIVGMLRPLVLDALVSSSGDFPRGGCLPRPCICHAEVIALSGGWAARARRAGR